MPLTLSQALKELPVLAKAKVVAGSGGLDRVVRWTHIIDHPDILPYVHEGYLLLTTAFALTINPASQVNLIPRLDEKKLAGLMVNVGPYMDDIPASMIADAERLNFPIITLPWEVNFTDVTHAIHEYLINEQYALSKRVFEIHEKLTQIVIHGGGLDDLTSQLADLLQRSVTIEDASFSLLAYKSFEPIDDVRARTIAEGRTPAEVVAYHTRQGLYERLHQERRPQKVDPIPELGLTLERVIAPIIVGPHLFGYIWVIATDQALTELDILAIERAANVAALILSRQQAVYEAEQRVKNQLFESLLDPRFSRGSENIPETLHRLGLSAGYQILVLECNPDQPRIISNRLIENCIEAFKINALLVERGGRIVVILKSDSEKKAIEVAQQIFARGEECHCNFAIGISPLMKGVDQFRAAYEFALNALHVGSAINPKGGVWSAANLGYVLGMLHLPEEFCQVNHYRSMIACLAAYDQEHGTELLRTLSTYIDQFGDINKTAQSLFIHRNTLYQRLKKIGDLCQVDLRDTLTILNLFLALKDQHTQKDRSSR